MESMARSYNTSMRTFLVPLLAGCLSFGLAPAQNSPSSSSLKSPSASDSSFADLGRGVNFWSNYLENPHPLTIGASRV